MQQQAEAPETIFETLRPRLLAISYRILASRAEAEDVIQETYLKWHRADRAALLAPAAWLTTVARHLSIDRLRQYRREAGAAAAAATEAQTPSPEDLLCRRADLALAFALLHERLSPDERIALVLHTAFECEHAEIAAELGTTASNSRQLLHRARERIL
ncbi:MAG TPA: sigma-70 family RNA polymerase sigma factor, partial [Telluria sp.]|nr:sigma-70 family RNA polymerase sigma factor [Telluria sp.]